MLARAVLVDGWALVCLLVVLGSWFGGYRMGRSDGYHAGRRELIREQKREMERAYNAAVTAQPYPRVIPYAPAPTITRIPPGADTFFGAIVARPSGMEQVTALFDQEQA